MPIVLQIQTTIDTSKYTPAQLNIIMTLISQTRQMLADDDASKNILNQQKLTYTDDKILSFMLQAVSDINSAVPTTRYNLFDILNLTEDMIIKKGAVVFALISEGLLQLKNQVDYSDSGLNIGFFNKTAQYQGWASFVLNEYVLMKTTFKSSIIAAGPNSGFFGIGSEFGYANWYRF